MFLELSLRKEVSISLRIGLGGFRRKALLGSILAEMLVGVSFLVSFCAYRLLLVR